MQSQKDRNQVLDGYTPEIAPDTPPSSAAILAPEEEKRTGEIAIRFDRVWKHYPSYYHVTGGIKTFLFNMFAAVKELRSRHTAIADMSLDIYKGENFGFVGRNGAGKSTTLGMIAGVLMPDRGIVTVNGRVSPLLELGAGFHPELTGRENILLNGVLMGMTKAEVNSQLQQIIEFSELEAFLDQPVRTYSSGMFSKLGFAVAANLRPEILLLDEILSVGDFVFAKKCEKKFEEFRSNPEVTMVLVSHSLESVSRVCDRAAWVEDKTIRVVGPAKEVVKAYIDANTPQITVPDDLGTPPPPHVWAGRVVVDCSREPAHLLLKASWDTPRLRLTLYGAAGPSEPPVQQWDCPPGTVTLGLSDGAWVLTPAERRDGEESVPFAPLLSRQRAFNAAAPLRLRFEGMDDEGKQSPPVWLAVLPSQAAAAAWCEERGRILRSYGGAPEASAPLWPADKTLRVVARNIVIRDAVGNFALGVAGLATQSGLPARLYALVTCPELAGIVSPIGDLSAETKPGDTVFYNWSIEDEFLGEVSRLPCRKVLYYHNVTPGEWFRAYDPGFADCLDRSRKQFPLFRTFDEVLANSSFSLAEVLPHLVEGTPVAVCAPCVDPLRLTRVEPRPVALPEARAIWLWVGRMAPHKQPEKAIAMFREHLESHPEDILVMVGGGRTDFPTYAERIQGEINALPEVARNRIVFLSGLSDEELVWLYRHGKVFLCTSGHEGFCLPVMEASLFGLTVRALPQAAVEETLGRDAVTSSPVATLLDAFHKD